MNEIDSSAPADQRDFGWALQALKNGHTVRRHSWIKLSAFDPSEYTTLELTRPAPEFDEVFVATTGEGKRTMFNPSPTQLLAEDWELV